MFKPIATIRSTPRLLPETRAEIYKQLKRIVRITLLSGPPLAFIAWWIVRNAAPDSAPPALFWKVAAASLAMPLMMMPYVAPLCHPRWGRFLLPKWEVWRPGLMMRNGMRVRWRDLSTFRVEPAEGELTHTEIVLRVERTFRGQQFPLSLQCLRTEIDPALIERLASAINNHQWPKA